MLTVTRGDKTDKEHDTERDNMIRYDRQTGKQTQTIVLFEPLEQGLSAELLASPVLVRVKGGIAYMPVVNVGFSDVLL